MATALLKYTYFIILVSGLSKCLGEAVTVRTNVGNIEGISENVYIDGRKKSVTKFLGIPYAEPPTGTNRFKKPVPKRKFNTTYVATAYPPSCYQKLRSAIVGSSNFSEDCLRLNVFVPSDLSQNASYPVMLWIHGGAFVTGSSASYPSDILSPFGDVVVVTINYRLGSLGFLKSTDGALIGNQGLWDQQLAIQWVHNNIRSFNGNPDEVTIFGESAGSISVIAQTLYGGNKGLFKRAIAQSGSVFGDWVSGYSNADTVLNKTGCKSASDQINCLRSLPARELITVDAFYYPYVDGDFIIDRPEHITNSTDTSTAAARAMFASVDIIIGVNSFDGAYQYVYNWAKRFNVSDYDEFFVNRSMFINTVVPVTIGQAFPRVGGEKKKILEKYLEFEYTDWSDPENKTRIAEMLVDLSSDSSFFKYLTFTLRERIRINQGRTYVYELGVHPTKHTIKTPAWLKGSNHADDLQYVFGRPLFPSSTVPYTDVERNISRAMMTAWTNFAKTSDPNLPEDTVKFFGAKWPKYEMTSQSFMKITNQLSNEPIQHSFYPKRTNLWLEVFPEIINS